MALGCARVLFALAAVAATASVAQARTETVRWLNNDPDPQRVDGYRLHYGTAPRSYGTPIDVGLPTPDAAGVYTYDLQVPDGDTVYIAMTSYDGTLESALSNELVRAPEPPPPPPPNQTPESTIDSPAGPVTITQGQAVSFAGTGSDPDGDLPFTYRWDFGSSGVAPMGVEDPGAVTFGSTGTFTVTFSVTDSRGLADSTPASVRVTVESPPPPPPPPPPDNRAPESTIDAPVGPVAITQGQAVSFAGTGSDPDGDLPLTYRWDFGGSGVAPMGVEDPGAVTFGAAGTFTVTFFVTDSRGIADTTPASVQVTVESPPPSQPPGSAAMFIDVTAEAGVDYLQYQATDPPLASDAEYMTGGVAVGDYDGDGYGDLYVTSLDAPDTLFRNRGDGTFEDATTRAGLDLDLASNGAAWGDLDNDGDLDLYVTTLGPGQNRFYLFVNDGSGSFTEEALDRGAAIEGPDPHYGFSVTFGDYDLDGWLDIHTTEWRADADDPQVARPSSRLLRNLGADPPNGESRPGYFEDVTVSAGVNLDGIPGVASGAALSSRFADMDGDDWPDLLVVSDAGTSRLFWNEGGGTFSDGTVAAGVGTEDSGTGSAVGDYDGDGRLDWFVTSVYDPADPVSGNRLYRNAGNRGFEDHTDVSGVRDGFWGTGAVAFDLDNDEDLDLAMTNGASFPFLVPPDDEPDPMRAWRNDGSGGMTEASAELGLTDPGPGRGIAVFDYDRDGDLDLFVVNNGGRPVLYQNQGGNGNDSLRVEVRGTDSNRDGIGALVGVWTQPDSAPQVREIEAGSGFLGQSERTAHFGLGPGSDPVHRVLVYWPATARSLEFTDVEPNGTLVAEEPTEALTEGEVPSGPGEDEATGGDSGGGSCGLLGVEVLPILALSVWRRRRSHF